MIFVVDEKIHAYEHCLERQENQKVAELACAEPSFSLAYPTPGAVMAQKPLRRHYITKVYHRPSTFPPSSSLTLTPATSSTSARSVAVTQTAATVTPTHFLVKSGATTQPSSRPKFAGTSRWEEAPRVASSAPGVSTAMLALMM